MKRTDVAFSLAFSTAMSMAASQASKDGKPAETIKKLVVLSLKAGAAFNAGAGITPEIEQLAQDAELVKLAKEEDQTVADAIELLEKMSNPPVEPEGVFQMLRRMRGRPNTEIAAAAKQLLVKAGWTETDVDAFSF